MGESSSSLHEWEKPVFPWEQSMPSLFCSFVLWGTVMMSGWFRMASTPLLRSLLFSPSPVCPLCGRKPGNECYPTRGGTVKGHLGSSEENGGDLTQWIFIWALARCVCVCVCVYIHAGWPLSLLFFFKFFFPNATDETYSLFRIRKKHLTPWEPFPLWILNNTIKGSCIIPWLALGLLAWVGCPGCWDMGKLFNLPLGGYKSCYLLLLYISPAFTQNNYYILSVKNDLYYT